ncbi:MAG: FAD-binding protein, partial [Anaerolineales bacterium]|nr:FAD-binding protein [Anaerolineales bacterium]
IDFLAVDPIEAPVPIQPTAHYSMGGIPTDVDGRVLASASGNLVNGFFAAGECACVSVHGANRLGSNSLLEASVFGRRAGYAISEFIKSGATLHPIPNDPAKENQKRVLHMLTNQGEYAENILRDLRETMTNKCGIFRQEELLAEAAEEIQGYKERMLSAQIMDKSKRFNTDLLNALEADHLVTFSEVIVAGAQARQESRGAHSRVDFKERDDEQWLKHTVAHKNGMDGPTLSYKSVVVDYEKYPPQKRAY